MGSRDATPATGGKAPATAGGGRRRTAHDICDSGDDSGNDDAPERDAGGSGAYRQAQGHQQLRKSSSVPQHSLPPLPHLSLPLHSLPQPLQPLPAPMQQIRQGYGGPQLTARRLAAMPDVRASCRSFRLEGGGSAQAGQGGGATRVWACMCDCEVVSARFNRPDGPVMFEMRPGPPIVHTPAHPGAPNNV